MRALIAICALATPAAAELLDPALTQTTVVAATGDPQITAMAWSPDGQLYLTGKRGSVWVVRDGMRVPVYEFGAGDAIGNVHTVSECGLLGIAFDPAYVTNHFVYVFATVVTTDAGDLDQQIIRFTVAGDQLTERTTLIAGLPTRGQNHDGGALAFGPDGLIYWAVGNNGTDVGQGADLTSPGSKLARASTTLGASPPPGPFADGDGPNYDFTFARGLRNPYTMAFHPVTGTPWVSVVGDQWEQIFALRAGDHVGYPDENSEPGTGLATVSPIVAYRTGLSPEIYIGTGGAVRASGVVTVTTVEPHRLRTGGEFTAIGIDDASFNGAQVVASVPSPTTLTYASSGPDATSGDGAVQGADYGFVVLGGAFYDATLFPAAYRLNYFFGDFGSGDLVRVHSTGDTVTRVQRFATGVGQHIDASTGPDGALYIVNHAGAVVRITPTQPTDSIVLSPQNLRLQEGTQTTLAVSLPRAPTSEVTLTLSDGRSLVFTETTWATPQLLVIDATPDGDTDDSVLELTASAPGYTSETATIRITDVVAPIAVDTHADPPAAGGCCGASGGDASLLLGLLLLPRITRRARARC